jgi:hypothetical protein
VKRKKIIWKGAPGFELLREVEIEAAARKPVRPNAAKLHARAI